MEQYSPSHKDKESEHDPQLIVLSAKSEGRLKAAAGQLADFVQTGDTPSLRDIAYTLQTGREAMNCRLALVARNQDELLEKLKEYRAFSEESNGMKSFFTGSQQTGSGDIGVLLEGTLGTVVTETNTTSIGTAVSQKRSALHRFPRTLSSAVRAQLTLWLTFWG